jgi:S-DNA-T family DNA segregation ATPase FtsK/SpoIIIE
LSIKIEKRKAKPSKGGPAAKGGPRSKGPASKAKGKAQPDDDEDEERSHSLLREGWGLLLLSVSLVTVIALLSGFANPGGINLLGPYLGNWWADTLNQFAGSLPVIFLVAAVAVFGFKLTLARVMLPLRLVLALALLFVGTAVLLSIRNIGQTLLRPSDYLQTGGYLGNFIVHKAFIPVFGTGQFGPYLITAIGLLFVVVWGFRMSVVQVSEKSAASIVLVGRPFVSQLRRLWAKEEDENGEEGIPESEQAADEITKARALGKIERARIPKIPLPIAEEDEPKPEGRRKRGGPPEEERYATGAVPKGAVFSSHNVIGESPSGTDEEDDPLAGLDMDDPLAVRKMRDLDLERKRVNELNEWEQKTRDPEIAGLLRKQKAKAEERMARLEHEAEAVGEARDEGSDAEADGSESSKAKKKGRKKGKDPIEVESLNKIAAEPDEAEAPVPIKLRTEAEYALPAGEEIAEDGVDLAAVQSVAPKPPKPEVKYDPYRVPTYDEIFSDPPKQPLEFTEEELREQSKLLEDQLINFKVMGKVVQICPGPVITRYEVELAPGVKVSRISTLADDLALALRAKSIRILAPIPGKSVVGIEVPNRKAQIVYIKEILKAPEFAAEEDTLKITLGKTIAGEPYVMDLTRAPHLLIAGQTGSGKSVCINSIMASFLCSKSPDELRMILVDPKVVELKPYDSIPHLLYPVITQPDVAVAGLKWSTYEMDRRYEVLAQCGVRNIKGFNAKVRAGQLPDTLDDEDKRIMPYIVIIIDELADLMMVAGKEVETNIARIAQKARAVGIHLILATQRPSTNVITGTIKANLPTRISFQVASQIDARTIMDKMGAEKLLGRGDMLFRPIEFPEPVRLHGCFLDDAQAEKLASAAADQFVNYPQIQSFNLEDDPEAQAGNDEPRDEKFREAAELVVQVKQASVSLLQRRLGIGYARSGRLVDQLERAGIVGKERGSKPRDVLMDSDELQSFLSSGLNDE